MSVHFMCIIFRWIEGFKNGKCLVKDGADPRRPKTSITKANITPVKVVVEQDVLFSVKDIAGRTGILEAGYKEFAFETDLCQMDFSCSLTSKRSRA